MRTQLIAIALIALGAQSVEGEAKPVRPAVQRRVMEEADVDPAPARPIVEGTNVTGEIDEWIAVRTKTTGKEVQFIAIDRGLKVFPADQLIDKTSTIVEARQPGDYRLLAYTGGQDLPSHPTIIIVTVKAPQPPPVPVPPVPVPPAPNPPQPTPNPPAPTPPAPTNLTSTKLVVIAVSDPISSKEVIAALNAEVWTRAVGQKGHRWYQYSSNNPDTAKYAEMQTLAGGLPYVIIFSDVDEPGQPKFTWLNKDKIDIRLPANEASLARLIDKYTRK